MFSDSSSDDDSTLGSSNGQGQNRNPKKMNSKKNGSQPEINGDKSIAENNSSRRIEKSSEQVKPRPRLLRHRSKDPHGKDTENLSPAGNGSPLQRLLNEEQRLRKQNKVIIFKIISLKISIKI